MRMIRRELETVLLLPQIVYLQMEIGDRAGKEKNPAGEMWQAKVAVLTYIIRNLFVEARYYPQYSLVALL
jgi:hypothetical protein